MGARWLAAAVVHQQWPRRSVSIVTQGMHNSAASRFSRLFALKAHVHSFTLRLPHIHASRKQNPLAVGGSSRMLTTEYRLVGTRVMQLVAAACARAAIDFCMHGVLGACSEEHGLHGPNSRWLLVGWHPRRRLRQTEAVQAGRNVKLAGSHACEVTVR